MCCGIENGIGHGNKLGQVDYSIFGRVFVAKIGFKILFVLYAECHSIGSKDIIFTTF